MNGETCLTTLLQNMQPELKDGVYVFHTTDKPFEEIISFNPVSVFQESEGLTLIIKREQAEELSLEYQYPSRMITLHIHSSLEAVGFLAAITAKLAEKGMSVNPVSAYYHDHLFVPEDKAALAMEILESLSANP